MLVNCMEKSAKITVIKGNFGKYYGKGEKGGNIYVIILKS